MIVNNHQRPFDHLDALKGFVHLSGCKTSYSVHSLDGAPLYGKHIPDTKVNVFVDDIWSMLK